MLKDNYLNLVNQIWRAHGGTENKQSCVNTWAEWCIKANEANDWRISYYTKKWSAWRYLKSDN